MQQQSEDALPAQSTEENFAKAIKYESIII